MPGRGIALTRRVPRPTTPPRPYGTAPNGSSHFISLDVWDDDEGAGAGAGAGAGTGPLVATSATPLTDALGRASELLEKRGDALVPARRRALCVMNRVKHDSKSFAILNDEIVTTADTFFKQLGTEQTACGGSASARVEELTPGGPVPLAALQPLLGAGQSNTRRAPKFLQRQRERVLSSLDNCLEDLQVTASEMHSQQLSHRARELEESALRNASSVTKARVVATLDGVAAVLALCFIGALLIAEPGAHFHQALALIAAGSAAGCWWQRKSLPGLGKVIAAGTVLTTVVVLLALLSPHDDAIVAPGTIIHAGNATATASPVPTHLLDIQEPVEAAERTAPQHVANTFNDGPECPGCGSPDSTPTANAAASEVQQPSGAPASDMEHSEPAAGGVRTDTATAAGSTADAVTPLTDPQALAVGGRGNNATPQSDAQDAGKVGGVAATNAAAHNGRNNTAPDPTSVEGPALPDTAEPPASRTSSGAILAGIVGVEVAVWLWYLAMAHRKRSVPRLATPTTTDAQDPHQAAISTALQLTNTLMQSLRGLRAQWLYTVDHALAATTAGAGSSTPRARLALQDLRLTSQCRKFGPTAML